MVVMKFTSKVMEIEKRHSFLNSNHYEGKKNRIIQRLHLSKFIRIQNIYGFI